MYDGCSDSTVTLQSEVRLCLISGSTSGWQALIVMFVISLISFSIQDNLGDPLREMVGQSVSEAERQILRDELGLNDLSGSVWPFFEQGCAGVISGNPLQRTCSGCDSGEVARNAGVDLCAAISGLYFDSRRSIRGHPSE